MIIMFIAWFISIVIAHSRPLLDLNQRPSDYESPALTTELKGLECAITILINHAINMMII